MGWVQGERPVWLVCEEGDEGYLDLTLILISLSNVITTFSELQFFTHELKIDTD